MLQCRYLGSWGREAEGGKICDGAERHPDEGAAVVRCVASCGTESRFKKLGKEQNIEESDNGPERNPTREA